MKDITVCSKCGRKIRDPLRTYLVNVNDQIVPVCELCCTTDYMNDVSQGGIWFKSKVSIGKNYLNGSSVYNAIVYPGFQLKTGYRLHRIINHFLGSTGVYDSQRDCVFAYHDDGDIAEWYALEVRRPQGIEPYVMTDHMTVLGVSCRLRPKYMIKELINLGALNFQHDPGRLGSFIERHNDPIRLKDLPGKVFTCEEWKTIYDNINPNCTGKNARVDCRKPMMLYRVYRSVPHKIYKCELTEELQKQTKWVPGDTGEFVLVKKENGPNSSGMYKYEICIEKHYRHQLYQVGTLYTKLHSNIPGGLEIEEITDLDFNETRNNNKYICYESAVKQFYKYIGTQIAYCEK